MTAPTLTKPATAQPSHALTGTWLLLRFMLRRDRVRLAVWTGSIVALWLYVAVAFVGLYSGPEQRSSRADLMSTPATILMSGPGYGIDPDAKTQVASGQTVTADLAADRAYGLWIAFEEKDRDKTASGDPVVTDPSGREVALESGTTDSSQGATARWWAFTTDQAGDYQVTAPRFSSGSLVLALDYTVGAMINNELVLWVGITLAVMSILLVVRHTRAEEESSRSELVRAGVVGRHAPAIAAMSLVVVVNLAIMVLSALVLPGVGGLGLVDSTVVAGGLALTSLVFAAVASVTCQLTAHSRGASGMAIAVLGLAVMTSGIGNIQQEHGSALSWTSPIAWIQQTRVFVDTRVWPLALSVVTIVVLLVLAVVLAGHRDFGAGMVADRRGRADARPGLRSPVALAWRQQRTALGWWTLGTALMWVGCGTLIPEVGPMFEDMIEENPVLEQVFGATAGDDMTAAFLVVMLLMAGMLAVGYGIAAVLRARAEETAGRTEYLLATPVGRARWLGAQLAVAGLGAAVVMAAGGLGMAAGAYAAGASDPGFGTYLVATLAYLPAVAVVMGVTAALYAWLPRWESVSWVFLVLAVVVGMFGEVFRLPDAVRGLSPLRWVPAVPSEDFTWPPVLGLTALAATLFGLAFVGFRRRDVPVT